VSRRHDHRPEVTVSGCRIINFPVIPDPRGSLTFVEGGRHLPFAIERVFYLYDVPGGESRAGHALKDTQQVLVAMSGSFDVILDDGYTRGTVTLNRSYFGLLIDSLVWREIENFSSGAVCLVFASRVYDEHGYYRTYEEFQAAARSGPRASS
jgi:hypothetical protein